MTRGGRRGFTLIELVMVVAIIGILSTIAYPVLSNALLRTKSSERAYMLRSIKQAVEDTYRTRERFPPDPAQSVSVTPWNPPWPPTGNRRAFQPTLGDWSLLSTFQVEGLTYYSYMFIAFEPVPGVGGMPFLYTYAAGDLDQDGLQSQKWHYYERDRGAYLHPVRPGVVAEFPPPGQEDTSGPYQTF